MLTVSFAESRPSSSRGYKYTLFVPPKDAHDLLWEGEKCGVDGATTIFGADEVCPESSSVNWANISKGTSEYFAFFVLAIVTIPAISGKDLRFSTPVSVAFPVISAIPPTFTAQTIQLAQAPYSLLIHFLADRDQLLRPPSSPLSCSALVGTRRTPRKGNSEATHDQIAIGDLHYERGC